MAADSSQFEVYLESGVKRVLAVAVDWPGWCRSAKDETAALGALLQAAPRYAEVVESAGLPFPLPGHPYQLHVCTRLEGSAVTDMGVPEKMLARDAEPMNEAEVARASSLLRACWAAFDRAIAATRGQELRKGPRGGGREPEAIIRHVAEAEAAYTARVGLRSIFDAVSQAADLDAALAAAHARALEGLAAVAPIGLPPPGPRGGARWPARYFVRRVAYHVVDHTWEIQDRLQPAD